MNIFPHLFIHCFPTATRIQHSVSSRNPYFQLSLWIFARHALFTLERSHPRLRTLYIHTHTHTMITYVRLITLEICAHVLARFSSVLQILATPLARHDRALSRIIYNPPSTLAGLMNSSFYSREYSRDQWNRRNDSTQQISFRSVGYRVSIRWFSFFLFLLCKFAFK